MGVFLANLPSPLDRGTSAGVWLTRDWAPNGSWIPSLFLA
jgi:hypothetical protein